MKEKLYRDIESNEIVTESQLYTEYVQAMQNGIIDSDITFPWYIHNSLACFGGTLEQVY